MKKLYYVSLTMLVLVIALIITHPVKANNTFPIEVKTTKTGKQYKTKVYCNGKKVKTFKFKKLPVIKFVNHNKLNRKTLCSRKGNTLLIEVITGKVMDDKGNGRVDTKSKYNYIHYNKKFKKGDKIKTFCIYNPNNNYEDDILVRIDSKLRMGR